jgi:FkbM family methyltransferase
MITDRLYRSLRLWAPLQRLFRRVVRRLPHRQRIVQHFGQILLVDPSELSGFYLYYEQEYDDEVFRFLSRRLPSFNWAIDLGANIGVYTTFIARFCNRVDAFEPDKHLVSKLERNLHLNGIGNVTIHAKCVSDVTGTVHFEAPPARNQGVGKIAKQGITLPSVSLDDFLAKLECQSLFIKMDIEGAEWLAIRGAQSVLQSWEHPLAILMEIHPDEIGQYGGNVPELRSLLEQIGLTVWSLDAGELHYLHPVNDFSRFWWATNERKIVSPESNQNYSSTRNGTSRPPT